MENTNENPFEINPRKQKKYEAKKRAEEIKELEGKYKDELSFTETEDDESYEESEQENIAVQEVIEKIKKKDPEIYDPKRRLFEEIKESCKTEEHTNTEKRKEKSYKLKDYYREQTLKKMQGVSVEDPTDKTELSEDEESTHKNKKKEKLKNRTEYDSEQKKNIKEFLAALDEIDSAEELFKKAPKKEEEEIDPEEFLKEYVLQGRWKEEEPAAENEAGFLEEDSEEIELIEEFDKEIMPNTGGRFATVKKPAQRRKRKELRKKLRNREEEKIKQEEIKRLKNLKKQQFADRMAILKNVSGLSKRKLSKIKLEDSYNPKEFDNILGSLFGEEYFKEKEEKRPKIKGFEVEAEELKEIERLAEKGEIQQDRDTQKEVKKILSEIREIGEEYVALKKQGDFKYVEIKGMSIDLSAKDILLADDKFLKRHYSIKKFAPYQDEPSKKRK